MARQLVVHSNVLNEDRVIWVRMPAAARRENDRFPVLYLTDGGSNVNEIGSTIDFLADGNFMPPLIVVGITNTDRVRDLTPSHADVKRSDGTITRYPTSGGADKFLDFIQTELVPEIERRYKTAPYRIITGHSLGGLFAVHTVMARPELFNAAIASSPSLWWNDFVTLRRMEEFLSKRKEFNRTLFFSLGDEGGDMMEGFTRLQKIVSSNLPKGFVARSAQYPEETHGSTELLSHYAGLRIIFAGWRVPLDPKTGIAVGSLAGVEHHYRQLSERFGFAVSSEKGINSLGYQLLGQKKTEEALGAFRRNIELYPHSANTYDSLADALEAAGKYDEAKLNVEKAIEVAKETDDPSLPDFKKHLESLITAAKSK